MFSRRSVGDFDQTRSLGAGRPGLVASLTSPVSKEREHVTNVLVEPTRKRYWHVKRAKVYNLPNIHVCREH